MKLNYYKDYQQPNSKEVIRVGHTIGFFNDAQKLMKVWLIADDVSRIPESWMPPEYQQNTGFLKMPAIIQIEGNWHDRYDSTDVRYLGKDWSDTLIKSTTYGNLQKHLIRDWGLEYTIRRLSSELMIGEL